MSIKQQRYSPDEATESLRFHVTHEILTVEELRYLASCGANLNLMCNGDTPLLSWLILSGKSELCREMLALGADPNLPDASSHSPLHYAASTRSIAIIDALAETGAIFTRNARGDTPLHNMALHGNRASATALRSLSHCSGFNPNLSNNKGDTAIEVAAWNDPADFAELLAKIGTYIPDSVEAHSQLNPFVDEAKLRWQRFCVAPDVASLTAEDIRFFANIGVLADAFAPSHWIGHEPALTSLLASLDGFMVDSIFSRSPALSSLLSHTPTPQVDTTACTLAAPIPSRSRHAL